MGASSAQAASVSNKRTDMRFPLNEWYRENLTSNYEFVNTP
jgi:hypothetical protein